MRILLLKSLLLCMNCPSFLPILCGILFVFVVESFLFLPLICFCRGYLSVLSLIPFCFCRGFVFVVESFLFLPLICFCRGFLCVYSFFLFVFVFSSLPFSLVPSIISHEIRKTWEIFWKKSIVFLKISIVFFENLHRFLGATLECLASNV